MSTIEYVKVCPEQASSRWPRWGAGRNDGEECKEPCRHLQRRRKNSLGGSELSITAGVQAERGDPLGRDLVKWGCAPREGDNSGIMKACQALWEPVAL